MTVMCQVVWSERGYEGVIVDEATFETLYNTGFQCCAEDCDGLMEGVILRNGWKAVPWKMK